MDSYTSFLICQHKKVTNFYLEGLPIANLYPEEGRYEILENGIRIDRNIANLGYLIINLSLAIATEKLKEKDKQ